MSAPDVILVTGAEMPRPDEESPLLVAVRAEICRWCAPGPFEQAALVVCRTPWDYLAGVRGHRSSLLNSTK